MGKISWVCRGGPLAVFAEGYAAELARLGFTANSVVTHLSVMGQLSRWMTEVNFAVEELSVDRVGQFFDARRLGGQRRVPTVRMLAPLLCYLTRCGALPPPPIEPASPLDTLLERYVHHLVSSRGLAKLTVLCYESMARRFLSERILLSGDALGVVDLCGGDVARFLLKECSYLSVGSAKNRVNYMRSLLRFLRFEGLIAVDLAAATPSVAGWRDTTLPSALAIPNIPALISSCDRSQPIGLRDYAILMLLARLGLRSCEVSRMELDDINWRTGELRLRGKGGGEQHLPLPTDVGEALAIYLRDSRPQAEFRHVFLTRIAPLRSMSPCSIGSVVHRACERTGQDLVGPHRLRHALAAGMLRQGATLPQIGQVLRHRDLATTAVYAKVDLDALRSVAQPWPGVGR